MNIHNLTKKYSNGEITVVWKPGMCIHSAICWSKTSGLPSVFNPSEKPWINLQQSDTINITEQIKKCPSGALSFYYNEGPDEENQTNQEATRVEVVPNGPIMLYGNISITDQNGNQIQKAKVTALCRCGNSCNKPYCDGTHKKTNFTG